MKYFVKIFHKTFKDSVFIVIFKTNALVEIETTLVKQVYTVATV